MLLRKVVRSGGQRLGLCLGGLPARHALQVHGQAALVPARARLEQRVLTVELKEQGT